MPPTPPPPGKDGKPNGPAKKNRNLLIIGGAAGLGLLVMVLKGGLGSSSANSANSPTTPQYVDPSLYGTPSDLGGAYSQSGYDPYAAEMSQLQNYLNAWTAGNVGATGPAGPPGPTGPTGPGGKNVNPGGPISPPAKAPAPKGSSTPGRWITVGSGQTLSSLSQRYLGTSNRTAIAHANHLGTGAGLRTGQKLYIP